MVGEELTVGGGWWVRSSRWVRSLWWVRSSLGFLQSLSGLCFDGGCEGTTPWLSLLGRHCHPALGRGVCVTVATLSHCLSSAFKAASRRGSGDGRDWAPGAGGLGGGARAGVRGDG